MQPRYFKRPLPLAAVALLILAFLVVELTPGPCETPQIQTQEGREEWNIVRPNDHLKHIEITERAEEILHKYEGMFWRQPNVWATSIGIFRDKNGHYLKFPDGEGGCKTVAGFKIFVTERVDQNTLPPEDRIPDMLEGIPVHILEWGS